MLPQFPDFKPLLLEDQQEMLQLINQYPPYSDYNFASLLTWDIGKDIRVSTLWNNLIIHFNDYITSEPFYSFLGTNKVDEVVQILLDKSQADGYQCILKLIPETVINASTSLQLKFEVEENRDNFDYIFSIPNTVALQGKDFAVKRNFINRFKKNYSSNYQIEKLEDLDDIERIGRVFEKWRLTRNKSLPEVEIESRAFRNSLELQQQLDLVIIGLYVEGEIIGVSINQIMNEDYVINLYEKADITFEGVFQYLRWITCKHFEEMGKKYLNFEQDLGIEALRKSKLSYHPIFFLKKYTISPKP